MNTEGSTVEAQVELKSFSTSAQTSACTANPYRFEEFL
jgi:hypothetical protein